MKKIAIILACAAVALSSQTQDECTIDNTGQSATTNGACDSGGSASSSSGPGTFTNNGVSNLRRQVELQASAGVGLYAGDASSGSDINVASCHDSGSAGYHGNTSGGSVQENASYDPTGGSCSSDLSSLYSTITSAS